MLFYIGKSFVAWARLWAVGVVRKYPAHLSITCGSLKTFRNISLKPSEAAPGSKARIPGLTLFLNFNT